MGNETSKSVEGCSEGSKKSNVGIIFVIHRVRWVEYRCRLYQNFGMWGTEADFG